MLPKTRAFWIPIFAWPLLGMFCVDHPGPSPSLPTARLSDIHLVLLDPSTLDAGFSLTWSFPDSGKATSFEIFQSLRADSLGSPVTVISAEDSVRGVFLPLVDTLKPYTAFFAIRAVYVEPTGQKIYGDTVPVDSITVNGPVAISHPATGDTLLGRLLIPEVIAGSTSGVTLRQSLWEKQGAAWQIILDTCLPRGDCITPIIGAATLRDTLVLQDLPSGEDLPAVYCVQGTENFEGSRTGLMQSFGCRAFRRAGQ
jgi:hypothetical protein